MARATRAVPRPSTCCQAARATCAARCNGASIKARSSAASCPGSVVACAMRQHARRAPRARWRPLVVGERSTTSAGSPRQQRSQVALPAGTDSARSAAAMRSAIRSVCTCRIAQCAPAGALRCHAVRVLGADDDVDCTIAQPSLGSCFDRQPVQFRGINAPQEDQDPSHCAPSGAAPCPTRGELGVAATRSADRAARGSGIGYLAGVASLCAVRLQVLI